MSRYYMGAAGPHGKLHHHFSQVVGPFESREQAQQAADDFDRDFPGYSPWIQAWPDHWQEIAKSVPDQLAEGRARLATIQADIARDGDKASPEDDWPTASLRQSRRVSV